jgi:glutamate dehydrogenase (NAD(P)+)
VVQGFGAVGKNVSRFLTAKGAVLVAVADSAGAIHNPKGLDFERLLAVKEEGRSVTAYEGAEKLERDAVVEVACDIWIPAARPDVVNEENVHRLNTKLVVQGANIPFTLGAEQYLHEKGVLCVPDFIANAGGVICAAMEYHGAGETAAMQSIEEKLRRNTEQVLKLAKKEQILPREAALRLARQRVEQAMEFRRFTTFSMGPNWI